LDNIALTCELPVKVSTTCTSNIKTSDNCTLIDSSSESDDDGDDDDDITMTKKCKGTADIFSSLGSLDEKHFDIIASPEGWLDCTIMQQAHIC